MRRALSLKMAYRQMRARQRQMALSVVAVALGVGLVVGIQLMNSAVLQSFLDTADAMAGRASLTISPGPGLTFSDELVDAVEATDGVEVAAPLVRGVAFPDDGSGELLTVHGVDLTHDAAVRLYHTGGSKGVVDDLLEFLNAPDSIILGRAFAQRRGLKVGDRVELVTPKGVQGFTIRGLLDPQGLAKTLDGRLVVMDLFAAERAFTADGQISQIDVRVESGASPETVRRALEAVLPAGLRVEEPALRKNVIRKTVGGFQLMLSAFGLLAVLAGFVICYSRLGAVFEARTWQVGLLRAVGLGRAVVFRELLKESLILGAAGTALGLALGSVIGRYGLPFLAQTTAIAFRVPVPAAAPEVLSWAAVAVGTAVGMVAAVAAAVMPALRLARKQPVAALRMRGREMPAARPGWRRLLLPGVLIGAVVVLVIWQQVSQITALGHVTTALMALAVMLAAAPVVAIGGRALAVVWERIFGPTGRFAAKHIQWQPRRSALTVATLGVGLGAVLLFGMLGWSFERTLVSQVSSRLKADLIITSAFVTGGWVSAPLSDSLVEEIGMLKEVAAVAGEKRADIQYSGQRAVLDAYDPSCFHDSRVCQWPFVGDVLPDATQRLISGQGAIVSTPFSQKFHVVAGDTVYLPSPGGTRPMLIVAVTRSEPETAIIFSRDLYKEVWGDRMVTWIHVALDHGLMPKLAAASLSKQLVRQHRLLIRSAPALVEYFAAQARQAFSTTYLMEAMTFLLVLLGIGDTLAAGVVERSRQFATMRALGLPRRQLFAMVMLQGGTVGLLGLILALVIGMALGVFWVTIQFPAVLGWKLDLHFPYGFAISAAVLTIVLCLIGSLLPSVRASRLSVTEALRNE